MEQITFNEYVKLPDYFLDRAEAEFYEREERLTSNLTDSEIKFAKELEDICDSGNFSKVYELLETKIKNKAKGKEWRWSNKCLSKHEFESVFWEEAYYIFRGRIFRNENDYFYYKTLKLAMRRRATDITRKATKTRRGFVNNLALFLAENFENVYPDNTDIERETTNKMFVQLLINEKTLTEKERGLLKTMYVYPEASYRELAKMTGYNHPEQISRILNRIRRKLAKYKDDYNNDNKSYPLYGTPKKRG